MNFDVQAMPTPPNLIKAFRNGFDAIANHIGLILIPMGIDLFLWFGPHIQVKTLLGRFLAQLNSMPVTGTEETVEALRLSQAFWEEIAQRINLFSALRSIPVGVPSLMVSRQPITTPVGTPIFTEAASFAAVFGSWFFFSLIGLLVGTLYFITISQVSFSGKVSWRETVYNLPTAALKVIALTLFWLGLLVAISIPASCLITMIVLTGLGGTSLPLLIFTGILLWVFFPLIFSPHGIFASQRTVWGSVTDSVRLTRMTLPSTGLLILVIVFVSEGTDYLWNVPADTSWITLLAVTGHAFVTTGLLAASFIYYRDAMRWSQRLVQQAKLSSIS